MKHAIFLLLSLTAGAVIAGPSQVKVYRPAYPYEVIDSVPQGIVREADRNAVTVFLAQKSKARAALTQGIQKEMCPTFLNGDWTTARVAVYLDQEAKGMNAAIAAAYDEMMGRLSGDAASAIADEVLQRASAKDSADTLMVDVEATDADGFERIVRHMCGSQ